MKFSEQIKLKERCQSFGAQFNFFVHTGGCEGANQNQYDIWIDKNSIPKELIPYYWEYETLLTEKECCKLLEKIETCNVPHSENEIILYISNTYDIFFNFTHMSKEWKIGNMKTDKPLDLIHRIIQEDIPALNLAREITMKELVSMYGNTRSNRAFQLDAYKIYLLNCYLKDKQTQIDK